MNTNKITIVGSIIIIILIISIPTIYKVVMIHHNNLYRVVEEKIIEQAKKCRNDGVCLNETITLKELYQNNYLDKVSDPVTKEYYNEESYLKIENDKYEFIVKE